MLNPSPSGRLHISTSICCITLLLTGKIWSLVNNSSIFSCYLHWWHFLINHSTLLLDKSLNTNVMSGKFFQKFFGNASLRRSEAIAFTFESVPDSTWTSWVTLHKIWNFPLRIFSVYITKSAGNCGFVHVYWKNP